MDEKIRVIPKDLYDRLELIEKVVVLKHVESGKWRIIVENEN